MEVSAGLWAATILALVGVIVADLIIVDRRPHPYTAREATRWVIFYISLALVFAGFVAATFGGRYGGEFLAGYITEYSLSVDNLFVFMIIISSFAVPPEHRHRVLTVGIVIALVLRGILIVLGAAAIERFAATFYLFGAFLLFTAVQVWRNGDDEPDPEGNPLIRVVERRVPTTREYHGTKLVVRLDGRRVITPMALVMLAIGTTDLLFALDSIPAVFGLTEEAYLVFTANAFALMGLRQLYFMLHGLLDRLIYLSKGLAIILGFIAVKLLLHAIHETTDLPVPEISIAMSLAVIVGVLAVTAVASLVAVRRNPALAERSPEMLAEREAAEVAGEALGHLPPEAGHER
ncbi:MAG: TerC family protein [Candidatus Nanopelagicales bacterium]|nr:TerC family protein [Candidatus Nanopelagicales bacterium]